MKRVTLTLAVLAALATPAGILASNVGDGGQSLGPCNAANYGAVAYINIGGSHKLVCSVKFTPAPTYYWKQIY